MGLSFTHAAMEKLLERSLTSVLRLTGLPAPKDGSSIEDRKTEFTRATPSVRRADCVFLVQASHEYYVVGEVQREIDPEKPDVWTDYVAFMKGRGKPVELIVVTFSTEVEAWARSPIQFTSRGSWTPTVIGPSTTPRMLTSEQLAENPWWGLFCSMIHARKDYAEPLYKATMNQCIDSYEAGKLSHRDMDEISDTMLEVVTERVRQHFMELDMRTRTFWEEFKAEAFEKGIEEGVEKGIEKGIEKGKEEGLRASVLRVAKARGLSLSQKHLEILEGCHDQHRLEQWLEAIVSAEDSKDVFES
ncbi:hypothetical protein FRD01_12055 [Microvenator marinus]|jgi:hypothetical protein|uniref:DUF4351 domain-containing protein n=1 Tax=Microvenator marinus TaxID=2600177 RepID=A0A5B8XW39_9DELT|nr:hypothetical protein [Microvenator marinus]QED27956.1 hypothetical protein FRD01_12055 [Microvenator marinus]